MRRALYTFYFRAEKLIAPHLRSSQYAYYERLRDVVTPTSRWLDLGCGHQVFGEWMTREQHEVVSTAARVAGIDLDWPGLRAHRSIRLKVFGDLARLPFPDGSFDVVSANMVMEHIPKPAVILEEVRRVLAPGGAFVFHTPNYYYWGTLAAVAMPDRLKKILVRALEGRAEADVFPTHYQINTKRDVLTHAAASAFVVKDVTQVSTSAALKIFGPVVVAELLYLRAMELPIFAGLRSNLVATLQKPMSVPPSHRRSTIESEEQSRAARAAVPEQMLQ